MSKTEKVEYGILISKRIKQLDKKITAFDSHFMKDTNLSLI